MHSYYISLKNSFLRRIIVLDMTFSSLDINLLDLNVWYLFIASSAYLVIITSLFRSSFNYSFKSISPPGKLIWLKSVPRVSSNSFSNLRDSFSNFNLLYLSSPTSFLNTSDLGIVIFSIGFYWSLPDFFISKNLAIINIKNFTNLNYILFILIIPRIWWLMIYLL